MISPSPGICKGSQTSPSSRASYLKPFKVLEVIRMKQCPLRTCCFPSYVWFLPASGISDDVVNIFAVWWLSMQFNNSQLLYRGMVLWVFCLVWGSWCLLSRAFSNSGASQSCLPYSSKLQCNLRFFISKEIKTIVKHFVLKMALHSLKSLGKLSSLFLSWWKP